MVGGPDVRLITVWFAWTIREVTCSGWKKENWAVRSRFATPCEKSGRKPRQFAIDPVAFVR